MIFFRHLQCDVAFQLVIHQHPSMRLPVGEVGATVIMVALIAHLSALHAAHDSPLQRKSMTHAR